MFTVLDEWTVDNYVIYRVRMKHGQKMEFYGYTIDGSDIRDSKSTEFYLTIEHAMAAAIAEKHIGRRGASGTAVGTADDWFMKMCGIHY